MTSVMDKGKERKLKPWILLLPSLTNWATVCWHSTLFHTNTAARATQNSSQANLIQFKSILRQCAYYIMIPDFNISGMHASEEELKH